MVKVKTMFFISVSLATMLFSEQLVEKSEGGGVVSNNRSEITPNSSIQLPTSTVTDTILNSSSTENSNSYTSNIVQIGKGNLRLNEIPQSVSVVTRQRLDDQNLQTVEQAMQQTPGVTIYPYGEGGTFLIRGYAVDTFQFDGLATKGRWLTIDSFDTAMFDHIEVLKGPSGLLQGSGEPAGTINLVRKRALRDFSVRGTLMGGSWESYRGEVDITGAFDKKGNFRGRIVAVQDNRKSYIDEVFNNKSVIYGTLEYDFTPFTTLSIGATYEADRFMLTSGLPASGKNGKLLDLPRSTFLGDKWNRYNKDIARYFLDLEHHLSNGGEIRFATSFLDRTMKYKASTYPSYPNLNTGDIKVSLNESDMKTQIFSIDAYITTPFELFKNTHNILVGINYNNDKDSTNTGSVGQISKNIFNPIHNSPEPDYSRAVSTYSDSIKRMETGMYGQLRFKIINNVTLVGGGRLSWWESKTDKIKINAEITPYAGIIYDINKEYALYVSYANIFVPQGDHTADNKIIKPRTGNQYEIGAKASWFDGGLNASSAFFLLDDENRAIEDLEHPRFSVAQGKLRNYGFEAELSGNIMPWWDILAGYTFFESKVLNDESRGGNGLRAVIPKHSFKLWSSHTISNFKIGYGAVVSSDMYAQYGDYRKLQNSYAIFSVMLGYKINKNFDLAFNMDNIFDHKYYIRTSGLSSKNFYGEPRSFMFTIRAKY